MNFIDKLASNIRDARIDAGLTQTTLAETLGVSRNCISNYENGRRMPGVDVVSMMAYVFGVSVADLVPRISPPDVQVDPSQTNIFELLERQ